MYENVTGFGRQRSSGVLKPFPNREVLMRSISFASVFLLLAFCLAASAPAGDPVPNAPQPKPAGARLANANDVRKRLGLTPEYDTVRGVPALKIAVLDY